MVPDPAREKALVTVTVEFDGPTESMTLSVIVPNEGDEEAVRDRGIAKAKDLALQFATYPRKCFQADHDHSRAKGSSHPFPSGPPRLSSLLMTNALFALGTLADAADAVETGAGTVHERLFEAFTHLARIGPDDIPEGNLRAAFAELMAALTSEKGTEGRLVATLKVIDEEQAQSIARAIVDQYQALGRSLHER